MNIKIMILLHWKVLESLNISGNVISHTKNTHTNPYMFASLDTAEHRSEQCTRSHQNLLEIQKILLFPTPLAGCIFFVNDPYIAKLVIQKSRDSNSFISGLPRGLWANAVPQRWDHNWWVWLLLTATIQYNMFRQLFLKSCMSFFRGDYFFDSEITKNENFQIRTKNLVSILKCLSKTPKTIA